MKLFKHIVKRIQFRKTIKSDESINVVDSMVKAHALYKELSLQIHPDKHPEDREIAENLMQRTIANKSNYTALIALKKEADETLNKA